MADEQPQTSPDGNFYWDDEAEIWKPAERRDATSVGLVVAVLLISVILACLVAGFIVGKL